MRFLYIDSAGKEVGIPTVEALALRIELGAVKEDTSFYDSAADRWAPAGEHEIYRSLQRELENQSGGFVAPPPPAPLPPPPVPVAPPRPPPPAANPFDALEGPPAKAPAPRSGAEDVLSGLDFGLSMEAAPVDEPAAAADRSDSDFGMEAEAAAPAAKEEPANFDFQGFGGMLADDDDDEEDEPEDTPPPAAPADDHGMQLEGVLASAYGGDAADAGGGVVGHGMEMEQPLGELPVDSGGWTPKDRLTVDAADEASESSEERAKREESRSEKPPRARPAAPPPEPKSSGIGALVGIAVVVLLVAGGGFFAFTKMRGGEEAVVEDEVVDPPVEIPAIAAELEPRMRELADSAELDFLAALRTALPAAAGVAAEPDPEWLAGRYLGEASQFENVEQYWTALDGFVDDLLARDHEMFAQFYQVRLDSAGVAEADSTSMLARARAGFEAGRPERRPTYRRLRNVIAAAAGLHEFLVQNDDAIAYEPASTRDPVLEAIPSTPELGRDMWDRVDGITESLDSLGALDKVTTDRLMELVGAKIGAVPLR